MTNFSSDGRICMERQIDTDHNYNYSDFNKISEVADWIKSNKYEKVCLQFPDNLLHISTDVYEALKSKVDVDLFVQADTTFSSCCVDEVTAMHVQADAVIHYGHACLSSCSIPVFYCFPEVKLDLPLLMQKLQQVLPDIETANTCLFYDVAYDYIKDEIVESWYKINPSGYIANINLNKSDVNVLGRKIVNREGATLDVDDYSDFTCIYMGSRSQALFNMVISLNAKWLLLDPEFGGVQPLDESSWFKRRRYLIEKCKDANNIGILVCKLSGKTTKQIINRVKNLCKKSNRKSYIISVGKPNVPKLANFPEIDLYVLIACPENDLYSCRDFYKPFIYPYELEVALNNYDMVDSQQITDIEKLLLKDIDDSKLNESSNEMDVSLISGRVRGNNNEQVEKCTALEKVDWTLQTIGDQLAHKTWRGLEQKLGETEVNKYEIGRSGLPISYDNEPKQ